MPVTPTELLQAAIYASHEAGRSTLRYFQTSAFTVETKEDESPVTIADRSAEEWLRQFISKEFPDHGILGEEFGETDGKGEYRWILDPIDGTKSFIHGVPFYGTMIAIEDLRAKDAVVGVVCFPALNETIWAAKGAGTFINGRRVTVSGVNTLSEALLLTSDLKSFGPYAEAGNRLLHEVRLARTWGDCYGHYMVAAGRAEIMIDPKMHIWDVAPLKPIIEEAGGHLFDLDGRSSIYSTNCIACNALLEPVIKRYMNLRS